jgi:hypothetical protein
MPKYRLVKGKGGKGQRKRGAIPCVMFLVALMALLLLLFYGVLKGGMGHAG